MSFRPMAATAASGALQARLALLLTLHLALRAKTPKAPYLLTWPRVTVTCWSSSRESTAIQTSLTSTGTNGELEAAKKAQRELPADATTAQRTAAQDRVDTAQAAHDRAMAAYNRVSAGLSESAAGQSPIYKAGVAEWMAKAAVTKSIDDYNKAVNKAYGTDGGMTAAGRWREGGVGQHELLL